MLDNTTKVCGKCRETKPLGNFPFNNHKKDQRNKWCDTCSQKNAKAKNAYYKKNPEKARERQRQYTADRPDEHRNRRLKWDYGITLQDYNRMLVEQDAKCAICHTDKPSSSDRIKTFAVDHCHKTDTVRGLLCTSCNQGLGRFFDNPDLLRRAADYLEKCK